MSATPWQIAILIAAFGASPPEAPTSQPVNRVRNGNFAQMTPGSHLPLGWTSKHPDNARRIELPDGTFAMEMTGDAPLMATYGVDIVSDRVEFEPNMRYRCTGYTRSDGPNMIVFVKGFATVTRHVDGEVKTFDDSVYQMRKEIPASRDWQPFNLNFDIKPILEFSDFQHEVKYLRITLWGFWPEGTCGYRDIRFEEVGPISEDEIRHGKAMTHVGTPSNVAHLQDDDDDGEAAAAKQQLFLDAANALNDGDRAMAAELADRLIGIDEDNAAYRVLAARARASLEQWPLAAEHATWLLDDARRVNLPAWAREWAIVIDAQVKWKAGDGDAANAQLRQLVEDAQSAHARHAAQQLIRQISEE